MSQRDGSRCVRAQSIAPDGNLAGPATAVLHLHSGNGVKGSINIGVTSDRLFVLLTEFKGNVWPINLEQ